MYQIYNFRFRQRL